MSRLRRPGSTLAMRVVACGAIAILAACSDSALAPVPPATAALSLDRDTATLVVGRTVQLSASGSRGIAWSTADARIATVSGAGLVTGVAPGLTTITATSGAATVTARVRVGLERTVGVAGDTLCAVTSGIIVVIPARALGAPTLISLRDALSTPPDTTLVAGTPHEIAPSPLEFARAVEVALIYVPDSVPENTWESSLHLVRLVDGAWQPVAGSGMSLSLDTTVAFGLVSSTGSYAVAGYPNDDFDWSSLFGIGPSGEPINHIIGEFEESIDLALHRSRNLALARDVTNEEVSYARSKWAQGDLGDLAATHDAVLAFIRSRLHRVGLPAPTSLEPPPTS